MVAQTLERLRVLEQGKRLTEDYAAKFWVLMQRAPAAQRSLQAVLNDYFCKGLIKDLCTALAMVEKLNTPLEDVIAQSILVGESLEGDDSTTKKRLKKKVSGTMSKGH